MSQIIGIVGFIGSGKDTVADYLVNFHGFRRESFANSLKDAVSQVFGWDRELLEGRSKQSREWRETRDEWWSKRLKQDITPRWVLQYWGTEVVRKSFHDDMWVASLENRLRQSTDDIVITDCRFLNELNTIKNVGGTLIRVQRGENPTWVESAEKYNKGIIDAPPKGIHASEYSSVGLPHEYYLSNDGSKQEFFNTLDALINNQLANLPSSK
jgi:hypothetical protein